MNQLIHKEMQDLVGDRAQIQLVKKAIIAREECIKEIRKVDQAEKDKGGAQDMYLPTQEFLSEMANLIQNLRQLSINVVEQIVLWRD